MAIIDKPSDYFISNLHTGNGGTQNITSLDFQADLIWIKQRNEAQNNRLIDSVRGNTKEIFSDLTTAEQTLTNGITAFNSNGFGLGSSNGYNKNSGTYVTWNWKAGGSASSNSDGSITSSVSANQDAGFSIVSFTGNATAGATIGHGLGSVPSLILTKNRDSAYNWHLWTNAFSSYNDTIQLNTTAAKDTGTLLNNTAPTSSLITLGSSAVLNASGEKIIAYVFSEKQNYSKFGSYTGNGNASSGTFVYTGFKPAFVMIKRTDTTGSWEMYDAKREGFNPQVHALYANGNNAEDNTDDLLDLLSNGFKLYHDGGGLNASGGSYIFMSFAENPFVSSSGVPATAR